MGGLLNQIFGCLFIFLCLQTTEGCIELTAAVDFVSTLVSHLNYTDTDDEARYYPNDYNICWLITSQEGGPIKLAVQDFHLQLPTSDGFCQDVVIIYDDSTDALDRQVTRWCGELNRTEIQSTASSLYISFTSDSNITGQGFVMEYYTTTQETDEEGTGLHLAVIVFIVVASVFVLATITIITILCVTSKRKSGSNYETKSAGVPKNIVRSPQGGIESGSSSPSTIKSSSSSSRSSSSSTSDTCSRKESKLMPDASDTGVRRISVPHSQRLFNVSTQTRVNEGSVYTIPQRRRSEPPLNTSLPNATSMDPPTVSLHTSSSQRRVSEPIHTKAAYTRSYKATGGMMPSVD